MGLKFRGGVHPSDNKNLSKNCQLEEFPPVAKVYIPLSQHIGAPAKECVNVGDKVSCGTLIGQASGFVSANVFSSVSGTVVGFKKMHNASSQMVNHVVIENDKEYRKELLPRLAEITPETIKQRVFDAGIVGMGGATFPTHVKLSPKNKIDYLIINGAECEPYITCDYRLCLEKGEEVIKGTEYLMLALGVEKAFIALEKNKADAVEHLKTITKPNIEIVSLPVRYPQGSEKQLIYAVTRRKVPCGALPANVGVVVDNVHTAYAVWDAVDNCNPLYKRAMTVSGKACNPKNLWVDNGVTYSAIYDYCKIEDVELSKVISGGPMMGFSQQNLEPATGKGTSSLLFLTKDEFSICNPSPCINCGRCAKHCPMNLMPMFLDKASLTDDVATLKKYGVMNCLECGCCSYICPAKRPLVQSIKRGKSLVRKEEKK